MYGINMSQDFFSTNGLELRTGIRKYAWYKVIVKELIDNALDAIEDNLEKNVIIKHTNNSVGFYDSGTGMGTDDILSIYNFFEYRSKHRFVITPSRGKQGNGLKCIIGICNVCNYELRWHTAEGTILSIPIEDSTQFNVAPIIVGNTELRGVEILNFHIHADTIEQHIISYANCNPNVSFKLCTPKINVDYPAKTDKVTKQEIATTLSFYSFENYRQLIRFEVEHNECVNTTLHQFLERQFGQRISKRSKINALLTNLPTDDILRDDFINMRLELTKKPFTLLAKYLIGLDDSFEAFTTLEADKGQDIRYPCLVEYRLSKVDDESMRTVKCYVNKSITFYDDRSICFNRNKYSLKSSLISATDLSDLFDQYKQYSLDLHIITPQPKYNDFGKTEIDISDFADILIENLKTAVSKADKTYTTATTNKASKKEIAMPHMDEAFAIASNEGQYSITARQMYYKLRELCGRDDKGWEGNSSTATYNSFTQEWLTEWLDEHDKCEDKVNFSERGKFLINGIQRGLGTSAVRRFISGMGTECNQFMIRGSSEHGLIVDNTHFSPRYKYGKALYIEKTGFDDVFKQEGIEEKYGIVILSGQGYGTRAAKELLYNLSQYEHMTLYCLHDLDPSGVGIYKSLCDGNKKFKEDLEIIDLGINPEDAAAYNIEPESVKMKNGKVKGFASMSLKNRVFFAPQNEMTKRVELNAFSTKQILELLDEKLKGVGVLPTARVSESILYDDRSLKEEALFHIMRERYRKEIDAIGEVAIDLGSIDGEYTVAEINQMMPKIKASVMAQYESTIRKLIGA